MNATIEWALAESVRVLAAARAALADRTEELFALSLAEVTAKRAFPVCRDALAAEQRRNATLTEAASVSGEAASASDSGCGGCGCD